MLFRSVVGEFASVFSLVAASSLVGTSVTATMFGSLVEGAKAEQAGGQDTSVRQLLARLRLELVAVSAVGIVVSPWAIPIYLGHWSEGALLAALVLWTGLYFSVAQFNLRLSMSARGKAGWDAFAMVAGLAILFGLYFWRLGSRIVQASRFPPPTMPMIHDTPVVTGEAARARGRLLQLVAAAIGVAGALIGIFLWRLVSLLGILD